MGGVACTDKIRRWGADMVNRGLATGALFSVLAASSAFAAEEGFFIGAGAGQSTMKAESNRNLGPKIKLDESDNSFKGYAGFNFTNWFGVEGGYVELGNQNQSKTFPVVVTGNPDKVEAEVSANGWQGFGVLYLPLGNFDLFAKVGGIAANIDLETKVRFPGPVPPAGTQHDKSSEGNGMMAYGAGAAYNFGHWSVRAEYEAYDTDKLDDLYNVSGSLQYTFFREKEKPAPYVAPTPAPAAKPMVAAAPAKCPDRDGDGVCDAADQCPDTPAGKSVDSIGCDCEYTLQTYFAFDSAVLTAKDKEQLDQLSELLLNPKLNFITGEVDGHTDNVGDPKYNLALSKRRADAVAAYVKAKGVPMSDRFITQGFGDTRPIADNATEEGRALNRRATLRRTDCPAP
jgi:outer membrane protein OmpA-like peptidoglycan-associated protein